MQTQKTVLTLGSTENTPLVGRGRLISEGDGTVKKTSVAEWLFSDENGQMASDVNMLEMEELYKQAQE